MDKASEHKIYEFGDFRLDAAHLMLFRGGEEIQLAPKAVETLLALIARRGEIVSKAELLEAVWPDTAVEESNLFLYLSMLRKTLGTRADGGPWIETYRRRGYRFAGDVRALRYQTDGHHYAWLVNGNDEAGGTNLQTQSGRMYILKDPEDGSDELARPGRVPGVAAAGPIRNPPELDTDDDDDPVSRPARYDTDPRVAFRGSLAIALLLLVALPIGIYYYRRGEPERYADSGGDLSVTDLTSGDDIHVPAISPDGRLFVYHYLDDDRHRLMLQQTGQLNAIDILPSNDLAIGNKTFSPDGNFIYFSARAWDESRTSVYRIPAIGGTMKKIISDIDDHSALSFSPDGKEFVFSRFKRETKEYSIVIARIDGTAEREVFSSGSEALYYPAWSPDGGSIAFAHTPIGKPRDEHTLISAISPSGGPVMPLVSEKLDNCYRIAWTSGGEGIVFGGTKRGESITAGRDQVWFADLSNGKIKRLTAEGQRYAFGGLTADNAAIVGTIERASQVWAMDPGGDSGSAFQLTRGKTDGRTGLAPLSDGRVGYTIRNGDNWEIWVMNADGSGPTLIYNENPVNEELRATPDGRYFVFIAVTGENRNLFRINVDGSGLTQLTFGHEFDIGDPAPAADSRSVLFHRATDSDRHNGISLFRLPIDGGEITRLDEAGSGAFTPHFSPDGKYISFIDHSQFPPKIAVLSTGPDRSIRYFDSGRNPVLNVGAVWTPDGAAVAYIDYQNRRSNILLQPIDGSPPRQLTNFTSGHIYRIAYSADGKRLYLARGFPTNDALLIKGFVK